MDFLINTGKRHRLVDITIKGNQYFTTDAIRERMYLQTANLLQFPHGRYSENLLRRDRDNIVNLYESNGFRDVKVTAVPIDDYRGKAGDIAVTLEIEEGPAVSGGQDRSWTAWRSWTETACWRRLSSAPGQPFSEFNVAVDRDTILADYFENGFPKATFEWSSKPGGRPHRVDLLFVVHEGGQQFVRQVLINPRGLKTTQPPLVARSCTLNPGDPLSPTAITDTQRRLYDLGVFAKVDAAIENPDGETDRKYVLYNMEEAARYSLAAGVGAELARIGGCQTCLGAGADRLFGARLAGRDAQQSLGPGPQHQPAHACLDSGPARRVELQLAALPQPGQPEPVLHRPATRIRTTFAPSPSSARRARRSFRSGSPRPARSSTATPIAG